MTGFVPNQVEDIPADKRGEDESRHGVNNRRHINIIEPKTCINCFQKGNYAFNISKLWERCACMTRINLNAPIKTAVFENSLPSGSAAFAEDLPAAGRSSANATLSGFRFYLKIADFNTVGV